LELCNGFLELGDGGGNVRELDDVCLGSESEGTELGEGIRDF